MSDWSKYGIHKGLFLWPGIWVSLAWFVFGIEQVFHFDWGKYGVLPGNIQHWYGVLTLPWLHGDVNHIISNTISLFFVGSLVRYSFPKLFDKIWLLSWIVPGIALWFIGRPNYHIGASAWLYALVSFVFFSGIIRMHTKLLAQSMLMVFLYGSFVWGVLPHDPTISYEGHLSGAIVGLVLAVWYRKIDPIQTLKNPTYVDSEVAWEDWKDPMDRNLIFEEVKGASGTTLPPRLGQQFLYEDGSSPDQLA